MNFQFDNFSHMLNMDGHGAYVWAAVVVTVLLMTWLIIKPLLQGRGVVKEIAREVSREKLRQDASRECA